MKKKNAIMLADTRPALIGNLLVQLKDTNDGLFEEALIYYDKISEEDKKVMESIMPCKFIKFDYELPESVKKLPAFKKFSPLMFARFYMFDLLNDYETITWIDTDVLICGKLDSIIEKAKVNGMSANFEDPENKSYKYTDTVRTSFTFNLSNYDMSAYNMSSGLITVADTLKNYELMTEWCFEKTIEYADILLLPDQGILNILIQEFDIDVASVGERGAYCFYPSYKRNASKAKIIHAWGSRKFWNSWYLYKTFPKWDEYYKKWLSLGGSDCFGEIKPDISVVIPMYKPNVEYFSEVLTDLLVNQVQENSFQYDNFEVILVVDGENNADLIKLLKKVNDPRIVFINNKERAGIAKSINIGMKAAKGEFIARVDDDDGVDSTRLYKQVKYLKEHPNIDLVTSDFAYFGDMNEERITFEGEMSKAWSIFTCPFNHPTIMFRKSFFVDNDLYYDETRSHVEDWELWLRAFDKGMRVGSISEVLYYHRWHNGSAGQNQKTIDMMRELVKQNFQKLNVSLTDEDLKIVPVWQGKVTKEQYERLIDIFDKALENNNELKIYDSRCLKRAFDLRMYEAKNGNIKDIVRKRNIAVSTNSNKLSYRNIRQKILSPFYKPIKRVFYNITSEAVNDNLRNHNLGYKNDAFSVNDNDEILDKIIDLEMKFEEVNKWLDFIKSKEINDLYFSDKVIMISDLEEDDASLLNITNVKNYIRKNFEEYTYLELFIDNNLLDLVINEDDIMLLMIKEHDKKFKRLLEDYSNKKVIFVNSERELKMLDKHLIDSKLIYIIFNNVDITNLKKKFKNVNYCDIEDSKSDKIILGIKKND